MDFLTREKARDITFAVLRIVSGLLFMQHGAQKLFGALGGMGANGGSAELMSLIGLAGVLEFFGGFLIAIGLLTRPVAFLLCGEMAVAYFKSHFPQGFFPIQNRGELSALYCFLWLFFASHGAGQWSVDAMRKQTQSNREDPSLRSG